MADSMSEKKISELLVKDLKAELEKRGLDQKGVKAVLLERLVEALKENGEDPDNMMFETSCSPKTVKSMGVMIEQDDLAEGLEDEDELTMEEEDEDEEDDIIMELVENSDDDNLEEEDIYGNMDVPDAGQGEVEIDEGEDAFNTSLDNIQFTSQEDDEDQEGDVEDDVEEMEGGEVSTPCVLTSRSTQDLRQQLLRSSILGAEVAAGEPEDDEEAVVIIDPTSATKSGEEDSAPGAIEIEEDTPSSVAESSKTLPDKMDSARQGGGEKSETETNAPQNLEKHSQDSNKNPLQEINSDNKETEKAASGKAATAKDLMLQKNTALATGTVVATSKSESSTRKDPPKDDKDSASSKASSPSNCNVWVSGLSKETRATDLKTAFSKYGKVIGAKIIWNAKLPGHHCYGFLSMASNAEAAKAISRLHRTSLHSRTIDVTWARNQTSGSVTQKSSSTSADPPAAKKDSKGEVKDSKGEVKDSKGEAKDSKGEAEDRKAEAEAKKPDSKAATIKSVQDTSEKKNEKAAVPLEKKEDKASPAKKGDVSRKADEVKVEPKSTPDIKTSREGKSDKPSPHSSESARKSETSRGDRESANLRRSSSHSDREKRDSISTADKIKKQRELENIKRQERKEREERDAERRRNREREERIRKEREEVQSRHREETRKLRREKELLEIEKGKLEKERAERLRMEKERIKLEQERVKFQRELEEHRKMEIQLKIEQERLTTLKRSLETQATQAMAHQAVDSFGGDRKRIAMMQEGMAGNFNNQTPTDTRLVVAVGERHVEKYDQRDLRQGQGTAAQHDINQAQYGNQQQADQARFSGGLRDSNAGNHFRNDSSQHRDDRELPEVERRYEPGRRENSRRDNSHQRSVGRSNDPPRRDEGSRKRGDSYRRDDGYQRIEEPVRRPDSIQNQARSLDSRRDVRDAHDRDERRVVANDQKNRYQVSGSRGGDSSYSSRESQRDRDFRNDRDKPRDSVQTSTRMSSQGGDSRDNWKGNRDGGSGGSGGDWKGNRDGGSGGSGGDWKPNMGGNQNLNRSTISNQFGSYQQQQQKPSYPMQTSPMQDMGMRMGGNTSLLGRGDLAMNQQQPQQQIRGSILGDPPSQESASWPPSSLDSSMNRGGSGSRGMQGATPNLANLMNQNQPLGSMMNNPGSMAGQFVGGGMTAGGVAGLGGNLSGGVIMGTVAGGLGGGLAGNMGMMAQGAMGNQSYMGTSQMSMGMPGTNVNMDRLQPMQTDNRFTVRRY